MVVGGEIEGGDECPANQRPSQLRRRFSSSVNNYRLHWYVYVLACVYIDCSQSLPHGTRSAPTPGVQLTGPTRLRVQAFHLLSITRQPCEDFATISLFLQEIRPVSSMEKARGARVSKPAVTGA
jgi:hypothetical protein